MQLDDEEYFLLHPWLDRTEIEPWITIAWMNETLHQHMSFILKHSVTTAPLSSVMLASNIRMQTQLIHVRWILGLKKQVHRLASIHPILHPHIQVEISSCVHNILSGHVFEY